MEECRGPHNSLSLPVQVICMHTHHTHCLHSLPAYASSCLFLNWGVSLPCALVLLSTFIAAPCGLLTLRLVMPHPTMFALFF